MKFSIVVPIYNVEKYIKKCLDSLKLQTYKNFEVILIDDGSTDNSTKIVENYLNDERFKLYHKENGGLSSARNYGISKVMGDYILFVDSDDYITCDLLETLYDNVKDNMADMISFGVYIDNGNIRKIKHNYFRLSDISSVLLKILDDEIVEAAWKYAYKTSFYKQYNFKFELNRYHEDFGLIPYILLKANNIISIDYSGYYYVVHENSIMTSKSKEKNLKRINDTLYLYDKLLQTIDNDMEIEEKNKKIVKSFISNIVIHRSKMVDNLDYYIEEMKKRKIYKNLLSDNIVRYIKKLLMKYNCKLYINLFVK